MKLIDRIRIKNFKSLRNVEIEAERVNVFIGEPNVGKSNILEALGLFTVPFTGYKLAPLIRFNDLSNLFFDNEITHPIELTLEKGHKSLTTSITYKDGYRITFSQNYEESDKKTDSPTSSKIGIPDVFEINPYGGIVSHYINESSAIQALSATSSIKFYRFKVFDIFGNKMPGPLVPPFGTNLVTVIKTNKEIRTLVASIFNNYGLKLVVKFQENTLEVQKEQDGIVIAYPYSTLSDTLLRIIFYLTALKTNKNSVLIFEEPEAHAFPYYTKFLAETIATDTNNQYFITTHNPYFITSILEKAKKDEVGVFITYYKNYETHIKKLSEDEKIDILDLDSDIFFNLNKFISSSD